MRCKTEKLHNFNKGLAVQGGMKKGIAALSLQNRFKRYFFTKPQFNPMVILVFLLLVLLIGGNRMLQQA